MLAPALRETCGREPNQLRQLRGPPQPAFETALALNRLARTDIVCQLAEW